MNAYLVRSTIAQFEKRRQASRAGAQLVAVAATMAIFKIVWGILVNFGKETSIAGLNNAAKAKSGLRVAYWLTIFGCFMGLTIYSLFKVYIGSMVIFLHVLHQLFLQR